MFYLLRFNPKILATTMMTKTTATAPARAAMRAVDPVRKNFSTEKRFFILDNSFIVKENNLLLYLVSLNR